MTPADKRRILALVLTFVMGLGGIVFCAVKGQMAAQEHARYTGLRDSGRQFPAQLVSVYNRFSGEGNKRTEGFYAKVYYLDPNTRATTTEVEISRSLFWDIHRQFREGQASPTTLFIDSKDPANVTFKEALDDGLASNEFTHTLLHYLGIPLCLAFGAAGIWLLRNSPKPDRAPVHSATQIGHASHPISAGLNPPEVKDVEQTPQMRDRLSEAPPWEKP